MRELSVPKIRFYSSADEVRRGPTQMRCGLVLDGAMDRSVFAKRNGEANRARKRQNRARKRQNRATIAADARRLAHVINTDGVLATHTGVVEDTSSHGGTELRSTLP
jgi:hypothetical protein